MPFQLQVPAAGAAHALLYGCSTWATPLPCCPLPTAPQVTPTSDGNSVDVQYEVGATLYLLHACPGLGPPRGGLPVQPQHAWGQLPPAWIGAAWLAAALLAAALLAATA